MQVSVVIPTYNGKEVLKKHLPSVFACLRKEDEVIIVDDCSTDDTIAFLHSEYPDVKIVQHATNMRYAQSCNDGVAAASFEHVLLLNNDVSPSEGLIQKLLHHFRSPEVFSVGCLEKNSMGEVSGRSGGAFKRGMLIHWRHPEQVTGNTLWSAGGSMMVRRTLWLQLGGMDILFKPAYEEDRDLSYRALKVGYKVLFEQEAEVFHDHETTNKTSLGEQSLRLASYKNMFLFYWKNITDIELLLGHLFWLPYHLLVGGLKTRGELVKGFLNAFQQLPLVYVKRTLLHRRWILCDHEVIEQL